MNVKFKFYQYQDFYGSDLFKVENVPLSELFKIAQHVDGCVAFNSAGWFKYNFNPNKLGPFWKRSSESDGIYVLTDKLKKGSDASIDLTIINLKRRDDRKKFMKDKLDYIGIKNYQFFEAVDGLTLSPDDKRLHLFDKKNIFRSSKGVIGCALSHYTIIKDLAYGYRDQLLILEDDVNFANNFKEKLESVLESGKDLDYDIIYLGYSSTNRALKDNENTPTIALYDQTKTKAVGGFFGYIMTRSGAKKLMSLFLQRGISWPIDNYCYTDFLLEKHLPDMKIYYTTPRIVRTPWVQGNISRVDTDVQNIRSFFNLSKLSDKQVTFTITSCKRLSLLIRTMDSLLRYCDDIHLVKDWILIDDQSNSEDIHEIKNRYPFMRIVCKKIRDKGHPQSMNILLDMVKTKYAMSWEDDWECTEPFSIMEHIKFMENQNLDQIIMSNIYRGQQRSIKPGFHVYNYNPHHQVKPLLNRQYDRGIEYVESDIEKKMGVNNYWWWPGFSLNPCIWNLSKLKEQVGRFNTDIPVSLFEYDYSVRCHVAGVKVGFRYIKIQHIGTDTSAYVLNKDKRQWDK